LITFMTKETPNCKSIRPWTIVTILSNFIVLKLLDGLVWMKFQKLS